ncbi:PEP-CTERM sorting domain-containing protein [Anabaena sp. UHCC 0187]|uniref:PEP-CTERM sorting domain-containing protein n=1 Tax=Anabaena sp. UHCC 0187 TaxID=2590018 RepID=UPI0014462D37|nr:PEP-CTERM sorting domain-containing protein [Anabaena sp. UHCC 0187]MDP5017136.1 PEP-CTERM sorting domain-containing protein [Dolichospermum sp.]MTJ12800.1 PEP-CTERM sorting domain-containing protein [Anabaena sp. UHCC 0187]
MKNLFIVSALSVVVLFITSGFTFGTMQTASALTWNWNYAAAGVTANGTFTTNDTPDSLGFYQIYEITGIRNGETITGLQPVSIPIPGNEPYHVDNLISSHSPQLTVKGFGYTTATGNYCSPFFADFLPKPGYLEVFSVPPFVTGAENFGIEDSELSINFSATIITKP